VLAFVLEATSMERETALLRAELSKVERGRGKRFSAELRERVIEIGARRRAEGASWQRIGGELGMNYETVRRWCVERKPSTLRRIEIVPTEPELSRAISIVSPGGFRAEGLTVRDAVMMLATLR
jgi:hypothetical protein